MRAVLLIVAMCLGAGMAQAQLRQSLDLTNQSIAADIIGIERQHPLVRGPVGRGGRTSRPGDGDGCFDPHRRPVPGV